MTIFENPDFGTVRTIEQDGKVLFCGKDVAEALGYKRPADAISTHCKGVCELPTPTAGGVQKMKYVSEGDIYRLAARSELPGAERFESWIFDEVLPTIRKHGAYMTPATIEQAVQNPDFIIGLMNALKDEQQQRAALETTVAVQSQQIQELTPKACYYDVVLNCKDLLSISKIAKDYGWSAVRMNNYLHDKGVQYKQGNIWLLYQRYAEQGYTSTKTHSYNGDDGQQHSKVHTYWTQKGRLFIYDLLKADGILPVIEREETGGKEKEL